MFRPPRHADGPLLWDLARRVGLDENSPYAYVLWSHCFASTSVVADVDGELRGFVTGFRVPDRTDTLFVWQVGVVPEARGAGLAADMLVELTARCPWLRYLEATVTPSNAASAALFRSFGARHDAPVEESVLFGRDLFPGGDHEAEVLVRIGPLAAR